jgi:predicted GNAT family acetyltransferase
MKVIQNTDKSRFEVVHNGQEAELTYFLKRDAIVLKHTGVPKMISGQGIAHQLAQTAIQYAKDHQLKVIVYCPFVKHYLEQYPNIQNELEIILKV